MEDDEREVGWAPRKIRKLEEQLAGTDKALDNIEDRMGRFSSTLDEGMATLRKNHNRLAEDVTRFTAGEEAREATARGVVTRLEEMVDSIGNYSAGGRDVRKKIEIHTSLLEALEERVDSMTPYVELESRVTAIEKSLRKYGVPMEPMDFSPPIGGTSPDNVPTYVGYRAEHGPYDDETPRSAYRRGYAKGQTNMRLELGDSILREAERRVRTYMRGHWSDQTIRAVVSELWGDEAKSPALTGMPTYEESDSNG